MLQTNMKLSRIQKGWTQTQLAFLSRVPQSEISRFENLRSIPYHGQAERMGEILGLKAEELQEVVSNDDREPVPAGGVG